MSSIDSALTLLQLFDRTRSEISVSEAAQLSDLPKSSVSRLFRALESKHFLIQNGPRGAYRIGPALSRLGSLYLGGDALIDRIESFLERLVEDTGATGYLTQAHGERLEIVRVYEGTYPIRLVHAAGTQERTDATSAGLAYIMRLSEEERAPLLSASPLDEGKLREATEMWEETCTVRIRSAVYPGFSAIGASVEDSARGEVYGLSLSYPESLLTEEAERAVRCGFALELMELARDFGDTFLRERLASRTPAAPRASVESDS